MTRPPVKSGFASRPGNPDSWVRAADAPATGKTATEAFTARLTIDIAPDSEDGSARAEGIVAQALGPLGEGPGDRWLRQVAGWTWRIRLSNTMYIDLLTELRKRAHDEAIRVFGRNLRDLLLAAPAGPRATIGLDPGIRTGVKVAVVDGTGKLVEIGKGLLQTLPDVRFQSVQFGLGDRLLDSADGLAGRCRGAAPHQNGEQEDRPRAKRSAAHCSFPLARGCSTRWYWPGGIDSSSVTSPPAHITRISTVSS